MAATLAAGHQPGGCCPALAQALCCVQQGGRRRRAGCLQTPPTCAASRRRRRCCRCCCQRPCHQQPPQPPPPPLQSPHKPPPQLPALPAPLPPPSAGLQPPAAAHQLHPHHSRTRQTPWECCSSCWHACAPQQLPPQPCRRRRCSSPSGCPSLPHGATPRQPTASPGGAWPRPARCRRCPARRRCHPLGRRGGPPRLPRHWKTGTRGWRVPGAAGWPPGRPAPSRQSWCLVWRPQLQQQGGRRGSKVGQWSMPAWSEALVSRQVAEPAPPASMTRTAAS